MRSSLFSLILLSGLIASAAPGAHAAESYDNCTGFITSVPAVITTQGTWCLSGDLSTSNASGDAIAVMANNVTIDCNHFKLGGLAAGAGSLGYGIVAENRVNTTIRNCNVRGFFIGVLLNSANGSVVEDSRVDGSLAVAIAVIADGYTLRRNQITDTGGSTLSQNASGITANGSGDILDNTVDGVGATGNGSVEGIYTFDNTTGVVADNRVRNVVAAGTGNTYAILNQNSGLVTILRNVVHGGFDGGAVGISCSNSDGVARDNIIRGFGTPLNFCSNGGNNYTAPALL